MTFNNIRYEELKQRTAFIKKIGEIFDEIWKPIYINDIRTTYICSNFGRIANTKKCNSDSDVPKMLNPIRMPNGYYVITLYVDGRSYREYIHRIIAKTFIPIPKIYLDRGLTFSDLEVNHKKGKQKWNNSVFNIEWVTGSDNKIHAYETHLSKSGEDSHLSVYTNDQIHDVCIYLSSGEFTPKEVSKITGVNIGVVNDVRYRVSWTSIGSMYDFSKCRNGKEKYDKETINKVKQMISDGKMSKAEISRVTGVNPHSVYYYADKIDKT